MKKKFLYALCCTLAFGICACTNDDPDPDPNPDPDPMSHGFFVLNQGSYYNAIEGSLTAVDNATLNPVQNVFQTKNGRSLGGSPQTAVVYGSHIYIGVYESRTIEIINRWTFESQKQISLASDNEEDPQSPRSMVVKDGKVYISMYEGFVCRLDTTTLEIDKTVKVGPNPERMAIRGNYLYVPNSDGLNWEVGYGTTASKIDLSTFTATTFSVGLNPTDFVSNGRDLFLLCMGNYFDIAAKVYKVNDDDSQTEIAEATLIAIDDDNLYYINNPYYGTTPITYKKYDIDDATTEEMLVDEGVESPAWLAVDPVNGNIIVTSYNMVNTEDGSSTSYDTDGYAKIYDENGQLLKKINVGVGPAWVFFDTYNMN